MTNAENGGGGVASILIVDDVPKNIQVVANILQPRGYRMAFAQDGKTALRMIGDAPFDLVLLDVMMPGLDGFAVCEELKKDPELREIPVIFLTARSETEDIVKGFEKGAVDYVTKPFNSAELLARVKTHLELKRSREQLAAANSELEELNATKDKFFSIIAHDLRNPIQALLLSSELLKANFQRMETRKVESYIEKFSENSNHIADLLENLLTWSRSQRGKIQCLPSQTMVAPVISESLDPLREHASRKNIRLVSQVEADISGFFDRQMVSTVCRNLISNAIKFTPGGGEVTVSADSSGENLEITVSDTGVGIPADKIDGLFSVGAQESSKGTAGEKGTGLGLILCKEFTEKNNGSIRVRSQLDSGSAFTVSLPGMEKSG